jgi:hypothetical protein
MAGVVLASTAGGIVLGAFYAAPVSWEDAVWPTPFEVERPLLLYLKTKRITVWRPQTECPSRLFGGD